MKRVPSIRSVAVASLLVAAAVTVPAWASSDDGDVERADEPSGCCEGEVVPAPPPPPGPGAAFAIPGPSPEMRAQLDEAMECMAEKGFGEPTPDAGDGEGRGIFIPREETESEEFRQAAEDCGLPPPPTEADIRALACADATAREERSDDDG